MAERRHHIHQHTDGRWLLTYTKGTYEKDNRQTVVLDVYDHKEQAQTFLVRAIVENRKPVTKKQRKERGLPA